MNYVDAMKLMDVAQSNFPLLANRDMRDTAKLWALSFKNESFEDMEVCLMRTLCTVTVFPSLGDLWKNLECIRAEERVNVTQKEKEREGEDNRTVAELTPEEFEYGRMMCAKIKAMLSNAPVMRRVM